MSSNGPTPKTADSFCEWLLDEKRLGVVGIKGGGVQTGRNDGELVSCMLLTKPRK